MAAPETRDADTLLAAMAPAVEQLAGCLRDESKALRTRDAAALEAAVAGKQMALTRLEEAAARLRRLAGEDREQASAWFADRGLGAQWAALSVRLAELERHNAVNGALIEMGRSFNAQLLDLVRGASGDRAPALYGRSGRVEPGTGSVPIARS